jgi:phage host-nuclease inhibitor protein Gam
MSKNRIKITAPVIRTREEMEALVGQIADLKICEAKTKAAMDKELTAVRRRYEADLALINDALAPKMECARAWAEANPSEFNGAKSIELLHGTIGWRLGNWQAKTLSGWTWDRVLEKLESLGGKFRDFVRVKKEVNKAQIIAERENLGPEELRSIGVRITQEEAFFIDPKMTPVETRETATA